MSYLGCCFISVTTVQDDNNTEYLKLLVCYWMSHNIWAQAYSRSCLNLHLGFIYVVKCGSSWGVEGCRADGQLIDQTASHLLIYSDRKSISSFFSLIPPPLRWYCSTLPRQTLITLLSFTPLYKLMPGPHVYRWWVLNHPYVILCSGCTLMFIPSVCLQHVVFHVIDFSPLRDWGGALFG